MYVLVKLKVNCTMLKYWIFFYSIIKLRYQIFVRSILETQVEIEMCSIPYKVSYQNVLCKLSVF